MSKRVKKESKTKKDKQILDAFSRLEKLYSGIPDTQGCMEHINKPKEEGGCGGWCCQFQNPAVVQVEWLHTWKYVLKNFTFEQIMHLIERAIRTYLSSRPTKGCIFFDKESKLCTIHEVRPFNCRIYGITPEEEIKPRIERLKILYKGRVDAVVRDQCNLVSTVDGKKVTTEMTSSWWSKLIEIEKSIGIKGKDINDSGSGTYMTYHDHLLIHIMPDFVMKQLGILRLHGENHEKETAIKGIIDGFRKKLASQGLVDNKEEAKERFNNNPSR